MNHLYIRRFPNITFFDPHENSTRSVQLFIISISQMRKTRSRYSLRFTMQAGDRGQSQAQVWLLSLGSDSHILRRTLKPWKGAQTRWSWWWSILKPSHMRKEGRKEMKALWLWEECILKCHGGCLQIFEGLPCERGSKHILCGSKWQS